MADIVIQTTLQGVDGVIAGLGSVQAAAQQIGDKFSTTAKSLEEFGNSTRSAGVNLSLLTAPLAAIGAEAVITAGKFEQTNIAIKTLIGNTQDAQQFLTELKNFAASSPFTFVGISDAAKQMIAMGFEARAVIPIMTAVGDATSALGTGQEGINRIVYALGQMHSSATLNSQDMRQLQQAFINGWQYIADATGKTVTQVKDETARGLTDASEAVKDILLGMQKDFHGMMEAQSGTLLGVWSNFQDRLGYLLISIGNSISSALDLKNVTNDAINALYGLESWWENLNATTQKWIIYVAFAVTAMGPLLIIIGQISIGVGAVVNVVGGLVTLLASPFVLAVTAAVAAIGYIITATDSWGSVIAGIGASLTSLKSISLAVWDTISTSFMSVFQAFKQAVSGDFRGAWDTLVAGGNDIKNNLNNTADSITKAWTVGFGDTKTTVDNFVESASSSLAKLSSYVKTASGFTFSYTNLNDALSNSLRNNQTQLSYNQRGAEEYGKEMAALYEQAYPLATAGAEGYGKQMAELSQKYYPDAIKMAQTFEDQQNGFSKNWTNWMASIQTGMLDWMDVAGSVYGSITSGFGAAVSDMLVKGKNWRDAISSFFKDVLANFVNLVAQMIAQWAIVQALKSVNLTASVSGNLLSGAAGGAASGSGSSVASAATGAGAAAATTGATSSATGAGTAAGGTAAASSATGASGASSAAYGIGAVGVYAAAQQIGQDKDKTTGAIGAVVGGVIGGYVAGPIGAGVGAYVGSLFGSHSTDTRTNQQIMDDTAALYKIPVFAGFAIKDDQAMAAAAKTLASQASSAKIDLTTKTLTSLQLFSLANALPLQSLSGAEQIILAMAQNLQKTGKFGFNGFAAGGSFITNGPQLFLAGEHAPETVTVRPMAGSSGGGPNININAQVLVTSPIEMAKLSKMVAMEAARWK